MADSLSLLQWGISIGVPAIAGLCGVGIGAWLTSRRDKISRRYEFLSKQLTDFYAPLLALEQEIETLRKVRGIIQDTANNVWREMCERNQERPDALQQLSDEKGDQIKKIINHNNEHLETKTMPAYRKMIEIFRHNIHLAEPSTVRHFPDLIEFVDIWDRTLNKSLPLEVIRALRSAPSVDLLYEDLQLQYEKLRDKLKNGKG